jgi:hypothetical protein
MSTPRLQSLVRTIWEKMQLAGEAGSLLKIEEEIETALAEARQQALVDTPPRQLSLTTRPTSANAYDHPFRRGAYFLGAGGGEAADGFA